MPCAKAHLEQDVVPYRPSIGTRGLGCMVAPGTPLAQEPLESWGIIPMSLSESIRRNCVMQTIAEGDRSGEVRYVGEFPTSEAATCKLVPKLADKYRRLTFYYEAGLTG